MQVNVYAAKTNLSKLIDAALAGEEVVIARDNKPVVRLVAVVEAPFGLDENSFPKTRSGFKFGMLNGKLGTIPDFLEPMPEDELRLWEVEGA